MKLTIETIKSKLQVALGLSAVEEMNNEIVTDRKNTKKIEQLPSSEEEDESNDESEEENMREMRYQSIPSSLQVSSVQDYSF